MNANCLSLILPTTLEIVVKSFAWLKDCGPATSWDLRDGDWIHCTPDHSWCLQAFIFLHDFLAATSKTDTVCLSSGYRHMPPYLACDRLFNPATGFLIQPKQTSRYSVAQLIRKQKEEGITAYQFVGVGFVCICFPASLSILRTNITSCEILALRITDSRFKTFVLSPLSFREPRGRALWEGLEGGKGREKYSIISIRLNKSIK